MTYHRRRAHQFEDIEHDPTAGATIEVWDHEPAFTGLLDHHGNEIWRDPIPVGFHHPLD